jgi:hypothetical protein
LIEALRAGPLAARFFADHACAEIVAVFERSLYLQSGRAFVCLGDARIGDGPINVIVVSRSHGDFIARSRVGESVEIAGGVAIAAEWRLDLRGANVWMPAVWPAMCGRDALAAAVSGAQAVARSMSPFDGLLPLVIEEGGGGEWGGAFERLARPRLARLESWILAAKLTNEGEREGEPPVDLLGLGPGLTPSGDDALCGVLLALKAMGSQVATRLSQRLAAAIERESAQATTALSGQFLVAAMEGQGSAVLHEFVGALAGGETARIPAALEKLSRVGHSSGLDAAAGVILALRALVAASHRSTQSP